MRSKPYRVLLVLAALLGLLVSFVSWCFLELVHWIQQEVYQTLPSGLGFHPAPWWWPLPVLAVAGVLAAVAIIRLPGRGGHSGLFLQLHQLHVSLRSLADSLVHTRLGRSPALPLAT